MSMQGRDKPLDDYSLLDPKVHACPYEFFQHWMQTDDRDVEIFQQRKGRFQAARRIMVAGSDDDIEMRRSCFCHP